MGFLKRVLSRIFVGSDPLKGKKIEAVFICSDGNWIKVRRPHGH